MNPSSNPFQIFILGQAEEFAERAAALEMNQSEYLLGYGLIFGMVVLGLLCLCIPRSRKALPAEMQAAADKKAAAKSRKSKSKGKKSVKKKKGGPMKKRVVKK